MGDSRAVLCRGGRALDLSTEHRVWGKSATVQAEIERIEGVGGWVDDGRVCGVLAVSRCARVGLGCQPHDGIAAPAAAAASVSADPGCPAASLHRSTPPLAPHGRAFGDMEFKGQEGLRLLLEKGLDFGLWDQQFADSRCGGGGAGWRGAGGGRGRPEA